MATETLEPPVIVFTYDTGERDELLRGTDLNKKLAIADKVLDPFTQNRTTEEILKIQCQLLKEIIGDELILPVVDPQSHVIQENSDYLITCVVASVRNVSNMLTNSELYFTTQEHLTLRDITKAHGGKDVNQLADENGYLKPSVAENTLKEKGFLVKVCGCSIVNLSLGLLTGRVALFIQDRHCRVISGIRKNIGGEIEYIVHDPISNAPEYKTLDQLYSLIVKNPIEVYISLIEDPKPTEPPIRITDLGE